MLNTPTILNRVFWEDSFAVQSLSQAITNHLNMLNYKRHDIVLVCVGTDRSTGDALGPVVGTELLKSALPNLQIYGTLDEPVHAANLDEYLAKISESHANSIIIAVDACLGRAENVGYITAKTGPLRPGTGVNKDLPSVGDMHIIGTVNVGGFMEYLVLQNTRLSLIMNMAQVISTALSLGLRKHLVYNLASASQET